MPPRLKAYVTTSGFFEIAVAAPSMKAALEIWGAGPDLFRRGYAKETNDDAIIKATMAKPGVVLKRAVGARGPFKENPELPDVASWSDQKKPPPPKPAALAEKSRPKPEPTQPSASDLAAERKAARLYEVARKKREREAAQAEARERKNRERRDRAIEKAESALQEARSAHDERVVAIERERDSLDRRAREEDERWEREKEALKTALRNAQA